MAYEFTNQLIAKVTVGMTDSEDVVVLNGINGRETNAGVLMSGVSALFDIVGWEVDSVVRNINQEVTETE